MRIKIHAQIFPIKVFQLRKIFLMEAQLERSPLQTLKGTALKDGKLLMEMSWVFLQLMQQQVK
jgi:hypothetical protein